MKHFTDRHPSLNQPFHRERTRRNPFEGWPACPEGKAWLDQTGKTR